MLPYPEPYLDVPGRTRYIFLGKNLAVRTQGYAVPPLYPIQVLWQNSRIHASQHIICSFNHVNRNLLFLHTLLNLASLLSFSFCEKSNQVLL